MFFLPMTISMSIREIQTSLVSRGKWKLGSRTTTLVVKLQQIAEPEPSTVTLAHKQYSTCPWTHSR